MLVVVIGPSPVADIPVPLPPPPLPVLRSALTERPDTFIPSEEIRLPISTGEGRSQFL